MLMPGVTFVGPIPTSNYASSGGGKIGACVHVIVGSASSALGEFRGQGAQLSSHFIVAGPSDGWPDGTILQVLDTDLNCYAQGDGNYPPIAYIAIEVAGTPDIPMTEAQVASVAAICAWSAKAHGFPIVGPVEHGTPGITTHSHPNGDADPSWGDHPCPGPIRLAQIPQMIAMAVALVNPPQEAQMAVAPAISFGGQTHVFQCPGGKGAQHKWTADGKTWFSENLFTAAGIGTPDVPSQVPGVSLIAGAPAITCEDSTGRPWYFVFVGGKWGVAELPVASK
jgi:hypothetical protein